MAGTGKEINNLKEGENMKLDRKKLDIAKARACMSTNDLYKAGIQQGTWCRVINTCSCKPETAGRIAKALGVDVTDILADD